MRKKSKPLWTLYSGVLSVHQLRQFLLRPYDIVYASYGEGEEQCPGRYLLSGKFTVAGRL